MVQTLQLRKFFSPLCPGQVDHRHRTHPGHLKHEWLQVLYKKQPMLDKQYQLQLVSWSGPLGSYQAGGHTDGGRPPPRRTAAGRIGRGRSEAAAVQALEEELFPARSPWCCHCQRGEGETCVIYPFCCLWFCCCWRTTVARRGGEGGWFTRWTSLQLWGSPGGWPSSHWWQRAWSRKQRAEIWNPFLLSEDGEIH